MKKALIILLLIPAFALAQTTDELDFISPLQDSVIAVKKGNSWGFMNDKGNIIIGFRDDLVLTETDGFKYPVFKNNRCLISEQKDGIAYFGYIDKTGETVIEPKFLNALNFDNNIAIVLKVLKQTVGENDILKKPVVSYKYFEVTIDHEGNIKDYLNPKGVHVVLNKQFILTPPKITSKQISGNLYAVLNENKTWKILIINK